MAARLAEVAARTADENPIVGDLGVRELEAKLRDLGPDAPAEARLQTELQLGMNELRVGETEAAIEHIAHVDAQIQKLRASGEPVPDEAASEAAYRLGVAYTRLGETRNCCASRSAEACILPIRGGGIHTQREGSTQAIACFKRVLEATPAESSLHLRARWLLNVAAMTLGEYPAKVPRGEIVPETCFTSSVAFPRFPNRAPDLGLDTFNLAGGAIVDDFDLDGDLDILISTFDPLASMRYFENKGDGTFADRTRDANLTDLLGGFNTIQGDVDNDGDPDALVLRGAWQGSAGKVPSSLLSNDGHGRFTDVTYDVGLGTAELPTQTAGFADYDLDGDLDLYIGGETKASLSAPCRLYRNRGGTFEDVTATAGVGNDRFTKSVAWGDYDGDRFPDLYVSNLDGENRLYHNAGDGTFVDVAGQAGVARPRWSFASWFWDFDNDGALDLFVAGYDWNRGNLTAVVRSMLGMPDDHDRACLYKGDGRGGFTDVASSVGLTAITLPMGANYGDLDNDGWLDMYLGTGYPDYEALMPNVMYRNDRGTRFVDVTMAGGFGNLQKGHGVVFADIDQDGDQDVFEQVGGFFPGDRFHNSLYENPGFGNHQVTLRLSGTTSNRSAIGARIRLLVEEGGKQRAIYKVVNSGGSFGANPLRQTIGTGSATRVTSVEVFWPATGKTQTFRDVADRAYAIVEGRDVLEPLALPSIKLKPPS
ncbi:MAG: CRTAC1 family protein [Acidobacteriota bacterium]